MDFVFCHVVGTFGNIYVIGVVDAGVLAEVRGGSEGGSEDRKQIVRKIKIHFKNYSGGMR
jgi:hypothetical protein